MNDKKENIVWFRNKLILESEANVNILSGMAQFGLNVFEGIRCYRAEKNEKLYAFRLQDHLNRLKDSCNLIQLKCPEKLNLLENNFHQTVLANDFTGDVAVRLTVLADGMGSWFSQEPVSYFIAPMSKPRKKISDLEGVSACVSAWRRISDNIMPPRAKVGANYINGRFAHLQALHDGYDFPLFLDQQGYVSEGAGACVMLVKNGKLITPSITSSILDSITRNTLVTLAKDLSIRVEKRVVDKTELYLADEVFMCGTAAEIIPVTKVDKFKIGNGSVGGITRKLLEEYQNLVSGENERYKYWLTEVRA